MTVFTWPNVSHIVRRMHSIFGTEGHLKAKVRHEILPQGVCVEHPSVMLCVFYVLYLLECIRCQEEIMSHYVHNQSSCQLSYCFDGWICLSIIIAILDSTLVSW